jgi:hypothetical protein
MVRNVSLVAVSDGLRNQSTRHLRCPLMKALILASVLLVGCASTPTVTSSIATAAQLNTAALTAAVSLANSGAISSAQLAKVITATNAVEAALVVAEQASNAGNATSATATFTAAMTSLTAISACLKPGAVASTIDACIAGVSAP